MHHNFYFPVGNVECSCSHLVIFVLLVHFVLSALPANIIASVLSAHIMTSVLAAPIMASVLSAHIMASVLPANIMSSVLPAHLVISVQLICASDYTKFVSFFLVIICSGLEITHSLSPFFW